MTGQFLKGRKNRNKAFMKLESKQDKFTNLIKPLMPRLERFALAMSRNRDEAADITGETIMLAYESFDKLKDEKAFLSFLFTIASRVYKKRQRTFIRFRVDDKQDTDALYCNSLPPDVSMDIQILYEAMDKLPAKLKEAILLFEILGFSYKEICEIQGARLSSVKMRIARGRKKLKALLLPERQTENNVTASNNTSNKLNYTNTNIVPLTKGKDNE